MIKRRLKKSIRIIISLSILAAILLISFFSYVLFARSEIKKFSIIDLRDAGYENKYIDIKGSQISYIEAGPEDGSPVVFVHGLGGSTSNFKENVKELKKDFKVYAIDLKGFGFTDKNAAGDYSYDGQAEVLIEFLNKKNIKKIAAAGHSMGGHIVLLAYHKAPERFSKLILIDSAGINDNKNQARFSKFLFQPLFDILFYSIFIREGSVENILESAFYNKDFVNEEIVEDFKKPFKVKDANKALGMFFRSAGVYEVKGLLGSINIPVLIIWGEQDEWIDVSNAYLFNELIKKSHLEIINGAGHLPMIEKSIEFNAAVKKFLENK